MRKALPLFFLILCIKAVFAQDTIPPVITLNGADTVLLGVMNQWVDPGVTITDNADTAFTYDTSGTFYNTFANGFADDLGTYTILYRTWDKAGNKDSITRTVVVKDTIPTRAYFYHQVFCTHNAHDTWGDSSYSVSDGFDKNSDLTVWKEGCLDTLPGIYKYRFRISDRSGNISITAWHYIIVKALGDNSPCVLTDSLKDTCARLTSGIRLYQHESEIKIYPNPAQDAFYINPQSTGAIHIKILDLSGKVRYENQFGYGLECSLSTAGLPNGIYVVEVVQNGKKYFSKLVVMH